MNAWLREGYAWTAGTAAGLWGFFAGIDWLAMIGALAALAAIADRFHAMWSRSRRDRERLLDTQIEQITGD